MRSPPERMGDLEMTEPAGTLREWPGPNPTTRRVLRWEAPPPAPRGGHRGRRRSADMWLPVAKELRDNPGEWGVILEACGGTTTSAAASVNAGLVEPWCPPGTFEATSRKIGGVTLTYARYVGGDTDG